MPGIRFGARRGVLLKGTGVVAVTYSITPAAFNIDEGSALTFTVTAPVDGTYTWTVNDITTTSVNDFSTYTQTVVITNNVGNKVKEFFRLLKPLPEFTLCEQASKDTFIRPTEKLRQQMLFDF